MLTITTVIIKNVVEINCPKYKFHNGSGGTMLKNYLKPMNYSSGEKNIVHIIIGD